MLSNLEEFVVSVLGYEDEGVWHAHALELDLVAEGETFEAAVEALDELVEMQVSFAVEMGDPDLLFRPAPPTYWTLFEQVRQRRLRDAVQQRQAKPAQQRISVRPLPPLVPSHNRFSVVNA